MSYAELEKAIINKDCVNISDNVNLLYSNLSANSIEYILEQLAYIKFDLCNITTLYTKLHIALLSKSYTIYYNTLTKVYAKLRNHVSTGITLSYWPVMSPLIYALNAQNLSLSDEHRFAFTYLAILLNLQIKSLPIDLIFRDQSHEHNNQSHNRLSNEIISSMVPFAYYLGPSNIEYKGLEKYVGYRKMMRQYVKRNFTKRAPLYHEDVAFVIDNPKETASDFKAAFAFINVMKRHYKVHCISISEYKNPIFDTHIRYLDHTNAELNKLLDYSFKYVIYVNHTNLVEILCATMRLGQTQIAILGHIITTGLPEMDYFILPKWDNFANYVEKPLHFGYMGCTIPEIDCNVRIVLDLNVLDNNISDSAINIFCPWTGQKINKLLINTLVRLNTQVAYNAPSLKYHIHIGHVKSKLIGESIKNVYVAPFLDNYIFYAADKEKYYSAMAKCEFAICSFPYNNYISLIDLLAINKPTIVLADTSRNSSQCAARMLMLFGLDELIVYSIDELISLCIKLFNVDYRESIIEKIKNANIGDQIKKHNVTLMAEFEEWLIQN